MASDQFEATVYRFLDRLKARDLEGFLSLWADSAIMEIPFAPPGAPQRLEGAAELRAFWTSVIDSMETIDFHDVDIARLAGSERAVSFHKGAVRLKGNIPYNNQYACLFAFDARGKITRYVEHFNPATVTEAFGGEAGLDAIFAESAA